MGATHDKKSESHKDSFKIFQGKLELYMLQNYKKGWNIIPVIKYINNVDHTNWRTPNLEVWTEAALDTNRK